MPPANFFSRFGFYVLPDFLDRATSARIRTEMRAAAGTPATIVRRGSDLLDEEVRRTITAQPSAESRALVKSRLNALRSALKLHFHLQLEGCEVPQFLLYRAGDYFRAHRDGSADAAAGELLLHRKISAVVFLNGAGAEDSEDSFAGGALTFYGLLPDPKAEGLGFPLEGEAGLLVCFPSSVLHEVAAVNRGERCTIASWFY